MLLESMKLTNFLPFKGTTEIKFSTDPEKNITLLRAENNIGKTSLLRAFLWCFYGEDKKSKDDVLNNEVRTDLLENAPGNSRRAEVELIFTHQGQKYSILRSMKYEMTESRKLKKDTSFCMNTIDEYGSNESVNSLEAEEIINSMLPQDLSEYFFFEENKFAKIGESKNIKKSVEDFCGLTVLNNAISDVKRAINIFVGNLKTTDNTKLEKWKKTLFENEEKIKKLNKDLETYKSEIDYYDAKIEEKNSQLMAHAAEEKDRDDYDRENNHLAKLKNDLPGCEEAVITKFNDSFVDFLLNRSEFQDTLQIIENTDDGNGVEAIDGITTKSIDQIIRNERCICGRVIKKGSVEYDYLLNERKKVPPNSISDLAKLYRNDLEHASENAGKYSNNLREAYKTVVSKRADIERCEKNIDRLKDKVKDTTDVQQIRYDLGQAKNSREKYNDKLMEATRSQAKTEESKKTAEGQIKILSRYDKVNQKTNLRKAYAEQILYSLNEELSEKQREVLEEMNKYVGKYFDHIYHGEQELEIDQDYNIKTYTVYKGQRQPTVLSAGTTDVKNFSFVFGLEQLARSVLCMGSDTKGEPYPLVLDGPFSHVDLGHISNLCDLLPEVSNQVIIAVSDKDYQLTKDYLEKRIGKLYQMEKQSEQCTSITLLGEN